MLNMRRTPCKCTGIRVDKCKCKVVGTSYRGNESGSVVLLTQSNSLCRLLNLKDKAKPNIIVRILENVYETCAGYNLRYCPFRGFLRHGNYFSNTLKDFVILLCFLIANFIVFLTIMAKMMVHLYFMVTIIVRWIRRSFVSKLSTTEEEVIAISPTQWNHDYTPPMTHKFL